MIGSKLQTAKYVLSDYVMSLKTADFYILPYHSTTYNNPLWPN